MKNYKIYYLALSIISGALIGISWPPGSFVLPVFFFLVPILFIIFDKDRFTNYQKISYTYVTFLIWNSIVSSWIYNVNIFNGILVNLVNPFYQLIPIIFFILFSDIIKHSIVKYVFFISLWISFEYLHYNWELAYPMLTLGNSLAKYHQYIQWYEYTGVLGGTLWVLIINIMLFIIFKKIISNDKVGLKRNVVALISFFFLPIFMSLFIYDSIDIEDGEKIEVIAVHPNLDCYKEKYLLEPDSLIKRYLKLTFDSITQETQFVIWPETAITDLGEINWLTENPLLIPIKDSLKKYPKLTIISGAIVYEVYQGKDKSIPNIRYSNDEKVWYHTYNAAIQLNNDSTQIRLKTKKNLVPFEETVPYPFVLSNFKSIIKSLGNFSFSYKEKSDEIFTSNNVKSGTSICYESAFGENTANQSEQGAQVLFIILNEGWYNNSNASEQFLYQSVLRAIETGKYVVRSSNMGVSAILNIRGDLVTEFRDKKENIVKGIIKLNNKPTFYTKYKNVLGILSIILVFICVLSGLFKLN